MIFGRNPYSPRFVSGVFADAKKEANRRAVRDGIKWGVWFSDSVWDKSYYLISEHEKMFTIYTKVYVADPALLSQPLDLELD